MQRSATATTQRGQGGRRTRGLGRGRGRGVTIERSDAPRRDVSVVRLVLHAEYCLDSTLHSSCSL